MKRNIIILLGLSILGFNNIQAQNEIDALRYSQTFVTGTSKSLGMSGAMGAIGGDFSTLSINPAGIGMYRSSEFSLSTYMYTNSVSSDFLGNSYTDDAFDLRVGNLGFVINNSKGRESGWISTSFGFGYNQTNNFNQDIFMRGVNHESSYLDNFVSFANNSPSLDPLYEQLAFDVSILPYDGDLDEYWNDIENAGYGQNQQREINSRGRMGEYLFSFGANYDNRLYLGASLGINHTFFDQTIIHTESDPTDFIDYFDSFSFEEYLVTRGTGYSMKFGAIFQALDFLRVGASFHLPSFYYMRDNFDNYMTAYIDADYPDDESPQSAGSGLWEYKYRLRTPAKSVLSAAFTIGNLGMLSVDYEFIDYRKSSLEASDDNFYDENTVIDNLFGTASNLRLGGELKLGLLYIRGGYGYYGSPFASGEPNVDSNRMVLSGGLGYRNRSFFVDAGYSYSSSQIRYYMYVPQMVDGSVNTSESTIAQVTLGFRF